MNANRGRGLLERHVAHRSWPPCRRSTVRGHAFPVAAAKVWNSLPSDVTPASSLSVFNNRLKTYLLRRCYETVWLWMTFPITSHYPPQNSGPCNSFNCLGQFKYVYGDDDDDDVLSVFLMDNIMFYTVCSMRRESRSNSRHDCIDLNQILLNDNINKYTCWVAQRGRSLHCTIAL